MKTITEVLSKKDYDINKIINGAKGIRRLELEIAEKVFKEWQKNKFGTSIMEIEYEFYLQKEISKNT